MVKKTVNVKLRLAVLVAASIFGGARPVAGQGAEPQLKVVPTGRVLVDGALYASPQKEKFPDGMAIPEARLGAGMTYGLWSAGIDVGYAYAKVGLRNMWIQYDFNPSTALRVGNFIHQFGLQSTSKSKKTTFEEPVASAPFTPGLQLGAMLTHWTPRFFGAVSGHVESSALTQVMNAPLFTQQGYGFLSRLVVRDVRSEGPIVSGGLSLGFATPQRRVKDMADVHDGFYLSANFPTKVVQEKALSVQVEEAKNLFKVSPEILAAYGRTAVEGQYFFQTVSRRGGLDAFKAQSCYVNVRTLLTRGRYSYVASAAQLADPGKGALECVADWNWTSLSDSKSGILGGRATSAGVTLNYYFNRYVTGRLNYTYTHTWDRAGFQPETLNVVQARLMVLF